MNAPTSTRQREGRSASDNTSELSGGSEYMTSPPPDWPETRLSRSAVAARASELPTGAQHIDKRTGRGFSTNLVLQWLQTWPGDTWQQRWDASGVESNGDHWREAPTVFVSHQIDATEFVARRHVVTGVGCLLCLRVLRPGYDWMVTSHFSDTYRNIRALTDPKFFGEVVERSQQAGHRERVRVDALNHLTRVITHTGLGSRELAPGDLLSYREALLASGRSANALTVAWDMLRDSSVFPAGTPTLQAALRRGQQSISELVDVHQLACRPVRVYRPLHHRTRRRVGLRHPARPGRAPGRLLLERPRRTPSRHRQPRPGPRGRHRVEAPCRAAPPRSRQRTAPTGPLQRLVCRPCALSRHRPVGCRGPRAGCRGRCAARSETRTSTAR